MVEYFRKILGNVGGQLPLEVHPELQIRRSLISGGLVVLQLLDYISQEGEHRGRGELG